MGKKKRILIIEDDIDLVETMKIILESKNYEVIVSYDTESGFTKIKKEKPDLIILDVMFGNKERAEGFSLARSIRQDKEIASIPILMITAVNTKSAVFKFSPETDGEYLPVDTFLNKPVQPEELVREVERLIKMEVSIWKDWSPEDISNKDSMLSPKNNILRLCHYRYCLKSFKNLGYTKIFSDNLGEMAGVSSTQVRKDFSLFGISGNKRGGYLIDNLIEKINFILGKNEMQKVILVGVGNLGKALLKYKGFEEEGMQIIAGFDVDPAKQVKIGNISVYPLREMTEFIKSNKIKIAILTVPGLVAQNTAEKLVSAGICGILNFAPVTLKVPEKVVVRNVNLAIELESIIYCTNVKERNEILEGKHEYGT